MWSQEQQNETTRENMLSYTKEVQLFTEMSEFPDEEL
jgi:hypothetical protein